MKKLIMALALIAPLAAQGQLGGRGRLISDVLDPTSINTQTFYTTQYKDIAGSPYIEDNSYKGVITLKDGSLVEDLLLRYNGYEDAVLYEIDGEQAAMIDPETVDGFMYNKNGQEVVFVSAVIIEGQKNFFEVIYEGKVSLYVLHQIKLSKKTDNTGGYGSQDLHGSAFKLTNKYLFLNEGGESKEVKMTKKSLLEAMEDRAPEIESYLKEHKLKVKEQEDLVKVLQYYDSL